jgi:hypothetical protein
MKKNKNGKIESCIEMLFSLHVFAMASTNVEAIQAIQAIQENPHKTPVQLEAHAHDVMRKMEKQRLWRWALRGIVIQ